MNSWSKNKLIIAIVILAVLIGGWYFFRPTKEVDQPLAASADLRPDEVLVVGEITCLPYKTKTADESCVKGIKGNDGKIYALNSIGVKGSEARMGEGEEVEAIGKFEPADQANQESSVFRYDGVLVLRSLESR